MSNETPSDAWQEWWELENEPSDTCDPPPEVPIPEETSLTIIDPKREDSSTSENASNNPGLETFLRQTELALQFATGHDEYQRHKIAYYILATWHIGYFDPFPGLVIYGPPSTGKTATLNIVAELSCRTAVINADSITEAALKQTMSDANNGTLIIEEADKMTARNLESFIIARYSKSSAHTTKMIKPGKDWEIADFNTFGATALHRRNLFRDPATLRRMIKVKTKRQQKDFQQLPPTYFKIILKKLSVCPALPKVENAWEIEAGIFDCFRPLVTLAKYLSDDWFLNKLVQEMKVESTQLKEEETYLEGPTLLKALISLTADKVKDKPTADRIGLPVSDINPTIKEEFGADCPALVLSANQRNRILREDFGFQVKSANGRNRVYFTIPILMKVCTDNNITDDVFEFWKETLKLK
jgi:hypothetical protein